MALGVFDYVVLLVTLLTSAAIGVYYRFTGGKQQTTQEYLLGDKKLSIIPVAFSLMASFMCASSMFGLSSENYLRGTQFMVINLSNTIATPIVAYVFLPVFYNLGYLSVYQYLEERFGKSIRIIASVAFSVQTVLRTALVLYAASLALNAIVGVSPTFSMSAVGILCTFYSTVGGIKAVIITDLFQSLLMFASVFAVIGVAAYEVGGLMEIWTIAYDYGRVELFNFQIDPTIRHTWWTLMLGGMFTYVSVYATNQVQVQRYLTMKDYNTVVKTLWLCWPLTAFLSLSMCFSGLAIFSKYRDCDPIKTGRIASGDQLMPLFVVDTMGRTPGLTGLFLAGVCSSALCSVSAALNSLAAVTLEDYIKPLTSDMADHKRVMWLKLLVIVYGTLSVSLAFCAHYVGPLLQAGMTILAVVGGPMLAVFTLGILVPYVNRKGTTIGLLVGLVCSFALGLGGPKPPVANLPTYTNGCLPNSFDGGRHYYNPIDNVHPVSMALGGSGDGDYVYLYRISYMYYVVFGFAVTVLVTMVTSLFFESDVENLNPKLFCTFVSFKVEDRVRESRKKNSTASKTVTFSIDLPNY